MPKIIAVANQKGGVGKTFLVFHLAHYLSEKGARLLVIDLDPQGNLSLCFYLGQGKLPETCHVASIFEKETLTAEEISPGLFLAGANIHLARYEAASSGVGVYFKLRKSLKKFLSENLIDFVIIDCPPSLGLFSLSAFVASQVVIVPLRMEIFSISGLADLMNVINEVQEEINPHLQILGLVLNALNPRTKVAKETLRELEGQNLPILASIPASIKVEEALRAGQPLWRLEPAHKVAKALKEALGQIYHLLIRLREKGGQNG